jgi:lauroyl/myristoyl acyltransferase
MDKVEKKTKNYLFESVSQKIFKGVSLLFSLFLSFLARAIGAKRFVQLFGWLGWQLARFFPREMEIVRLQSAVAAQTVTDPVSKRKLNSAELGNDNFKHVAESFSELFCFDSLLSNNGVDASELTKISSQCPGGIKSIGLSAHLGNFELLGAACIAHGIPLSVIGRMQNNNLLKEFIEKQRARYGVKSLWREKQESSSALLRTIRRGDPLAVLIDHDTQVEGLFTDFFGIKSYCPIGPIQLALRYNLKIFTVFIVRKALLQHKILVEEIPYTDATTPQEILDIYGSQLEKLVREYPEQWIWWHKKWRRRPEIDYKQNPTELRGTKDYIKWLETLKSNR